MAQKWISIVSLGMALLLVAPALADENKDKKPKSQTGGGKIRLS